MRLLIKGGRVIDPASGLDAISDVLIEDGRVIGIAPAISSENAAIIDAQKKVVAPGLIDMHVHFREPGKQEYKETIRTGAKAAAAGGFTTVVCEPNTDPPIDNAERTELVLRIARNQEIANVYTKACVTQGLRGKKLIDVGSVVKAGAIAITDDGFPVMELEVLKRAAEEAWRTNIAICPHCEESRIHLEGGKSSRPNGRRPSSARGKRWPRAEALTSGQLASEARYIQQYVLHVAREVKARFHVAHVSLSESVELIRQAKEEGLPVTGEATPHHFTLTDRDFLKIGPNAKVNPPLRSREDVRAVVRGLKEDILDVIASDHAPHTPAEKAGPNPPFGIVGIETTLGIVLTRLVATRQLSMKAAIQKMTVNPARILNLSDAGRLAVGRPADITIIDPERTWTVDASQFYSKGRNCPFDGCELKGRAIMTILRGRITMYEGEVFDPPISETYRWNEVSSAQLPLLNAI